MQADEKMDLYFYITGWIVVALIGAIAGIIYVCGTGWLEIVPPCAFHKITGLYCPGCGGTRAVFALCRGEIVRSIKFHPLVLYSVVCGGWFMISQSIQRISHNKIKIGMHFRDIYLWIALAIVIVNFIFKNMLLLIWGIKLLG